MPVEGAAMQSGPARLLVLRQHVGVFAVQEPLKQVTLPHRGREVQSRASKLVPQGSCIVTVDGQKAPQTALRAAGQSGDHVLCVPHRAALCSAVWASQTHFSLSYKPPKKPQACALTSQTNTEMNLSNDCNKLKQTKWTK